MEVETFLKNEEIVIKGKKFKITLFPAEFVLIKGKIYEHLERRKRKNLKRNKIKNYRSSKKEWNKLQTNKHKRRKHK